MLNKIFKRKKMTLVAIISVCAFALGVGTLKLSLVQSSPTTAAKKQLPIYCVDTGSAKKVAVSFDAA